MMNKEEAKKEFDRWFNPDGFQNRDLVVYEVSKLIDAIEPEHQKVVLPKAVGEQWDMLVDHYASDQVVTDKCSAINRALRWLPNRWSVGLDCGDLLYWWANTQDSYTKLADAARYGWVPEPEKLYLLPMAGTQGAEARLYACKGLAWIVRAATSDSKAVAMGTTVTQADLEGAPAWVQAIEKKEVSDNGEN